MSYRALSLADALLSFAPIRALGVRLKVDAPEVPRKLADPLQGALTDALRAAKLWDIDQQSSLTRDGASLTYRLFDPEHSQVARETQDRREACEIRRVIIETLQANGYAIRFSDALFCERGKKGWEIIVKARELR